MKKLFPLILILAVFTISCTDKRAELIAEIDAAEVKMNETKVLGIDTAIANAALHAYEAYYTAFPKDSVSTDYKYSAAKVLGPMNMYIEAIALLDEIINSEEVSDEIKPEVMSLKAFYYEVGLLNYSEAERTYKELIKRFPDSEFAEQARLNIQMLGLSGEELINKLKEINEIDTTLAE